MKEVIVRPTTKLSFKIAQPTVEAALRSIIRLQIRGRENLPRNGPIIAVFNHLNLIDPPLHIISIMAQSSPCVAELPLFLFASGERRGSKESVG